MKDQSWYGYFYFPPVSPHSDNLYVVCGLWKVIAAFNARKLELDDGAWRLDIRCIEDNFDLPLSPRD